MIFVSYAREDMEIALRVYRDLKAAGGNCWIDKVDLIPGQEWPSVIRRQIRASSYFLAILSGRSTSKRGFVQSELRLAMEVLLEMPDDKIFLIPCRTEAVEIPYDPIRKLQWVDLYPDYDSALDRICQAVGLPFVNTASNNEVQSFHRLMDQNLLRLKLEQARRLVQDPVVIGGPSRTTNLVVGTSRSERRLNETLVRLQRRVPIFAWTVTQIGGNRYALNFKHYDDEARFSKELIAGLASEGVTCLAGETARGNDTKGSSSLHFGHHPGEVTIGTRDGRIVALVDGRFFDAVSGKELTDEEGREALRYSNWKIDSQKPGS